MKRKGVPAGREMKVFTDETGRTRAVVDKVKEQKKKPLNIQIIEKTSKKVKVARKGSVT